MACPNFKNGPKIGLRPLGVNGNPNSFVMGKLFFPNLYKLHNFNILMDFYLVLLREVCPRSF
jgi:hypothetical protein